MATEAIASNPGQRAPVIEKLLDFFVANDGTAYYQVKWKPTWERADALSQFSDLVDSFWKFVNNAHTGNVYNNQSMHKGPDPVLLPPTPKSNNLQSLPPSVSSSPVTPRQKKNPSTPNFKSAPNTFNSPQNRNLQQTPTKSQAVVNIDSDEEDMSDVRSPSTNISSLQQQNMPHNENLTPSSMQQMQQHQQMLQQHQQQQQQHQQPYPMQSMWNVPKTEPVDMPEQKPFQGNPMDFNIENFNHQQNIPNMPNIPGMQNMHQLQQMGGNLPHSQHNFPYPMPNAGMNPNGRGRGEERGEGGRGGASDAGAKRKMSHSPMGGFNKLPTIKTENPGGIQIKQEGNDFGGMEGQSGGEETQISGLVASNWKDYFDTIESSADGQKVTKSFKCKVCGSIIAQLGNCSRHFKKHVSDGSGGEHECPICSKKFHRIDYIERHLKMHGTGSNEEVQKMIKLISAGMKKK